MSTVTALPYSGAFTRADLEAMPEDGHRYELLDGSLIVTPAPNVRHQRAVVNLICLLRDARPDPTFEVFTAPFDVTLAEDTVLEPDVLVARASDLDEHGLPAAPLLAVEVLSPSTWRIDVGAKRSRYDAGGCPAYWVFDPDAASLTVWEPGDDGAYRQVAEVRDDEPFAATRPYPVTVVPAQLLEP